MKTTLLLSLPMAALGVSACTQNQNLAANNQKRTYRPGRYTRTCTNTPSPYEDNTSPQQSERSGRHSSVSRTAG